MNRFSPLRALCILAIFMLPCASLAADDSDRFQMNHDIHIGPDDKVGDVTCMACSVHIRGQVSGDVTTIAGSIFTEPGASIAGDVTAIAGDARVENGTQVAGDLTVVGGTLRRDPQASVAGDVTAMGGRGWVLGVFLVPFIFLGGIIALIIWLIQRSRRPTPIPAYTLHRN